MYEKIEQMSGLIDTVDNFKRHRLSFVLQEVLAITLYYFSGKSLEAYPAYAKYRTYLRRLPSIQLSPHLKAQLQTFQTDGLPYSDYGKEARLVRNLKDLVNALYLMRETFAILETLDIREGEHRIFQWCGMKTDEEVQAHDQLPFWQRWVYGTTGSVKIGALTFKNMSSESYAVLSKLYRDIVPKSYQASRLLTHLDLSIFEAFLPEYQTVLAAMVQLGNLSDQAGKYIALTPEKLRAIGKPETIGFVAGNALVQLNSEGGALDVGFLTQLSASLPKYFQEFSQSIKQLSPDLARIESSVTSQQVRAFEQLAEKILLETDRLRTRHIITLPLYVINYARLLQNIIIMGNGLVKHFSLANETSKKVIVEKLRKLKDNYISQLVVLADKIEIEFMLKPGDLSTLSMQMMQDYWHEIAKIADNLIDLRSLAPDLLSLNSRGLYCIRKQALESYYENYIVERDAVSRQQEAFERFYELVERLQLAHSFSGEITQEFADAYVLIQDYVIARAPKLHTRIVDELINSKSIHSHITQNAVYQFIYEPAQNYTKWYPCLNQLASMKRLIADDIESSKATCSLNLLIVETMLQTVEEKERTCLLTPWRPVSEEPARKSGDGFYQNQIDIYRAQRKSEQFSKAIDNYQSIRTFLKDLAQEGVVYINQIPLPDKKELCQLYRSLQPFLHLCLNDEHAIAWRHFDGKMVQALTNDSRWYPQDKHFLLIRDVLRKLSIFQFGHQLIKYKQSMQIRIRTLSLQTNDCAAKDLQSRQLMDSSLVMARADYVFKWPFVAKLPAWIKEKRKGFRSWMTKTYGEAITLKLGEASSSGTPYPEIEDRFTRLRQPYQLLMLKQTFNALYYLEMSAYQLAELREDAYQTVYVTNLLQGFRGIEQLYELCQTLQQDPYLLAFLGQLKVKYHSIQHKMSSHTGIYQTLPAHLIDIEPAPLIQLPAVRYIIQALNIMPHHLRMIMEGQALDSDMIGIAATSAANTCQEIESLLGQYDSYVSAFFSLPRVSRLCYQLKDETVQLGNQIHSAISENLSNLYNKHMTDLLIEADKVEVELGIKSGMISEPVRQFLMQSYVRFVFQQDLPSQKTFSLLKSDVCRQRRLNAILESKITNRTSMAINHMHQRLLDQALNHWIEPYYQKPGKFSAEKKQAFVDWLVEHSEWLLKLEKDNNLSYEYQRLTKFENSIVQHVNACGREQEVQLIGDTFKNCEFRLRSLTARLYGETKSRLLSIEKLNYLRNFLNDDKTGYLFKKQQEETQQLKLFIKERFTLIAEVYKRERMIGVARLNADYSKHITHHLQQNLQQIESVIFSDYAERIEQDDLTPVIERLTRHAIKGFIDSEYPNYVLLCGFLVKLEEFRGFCASVSVSEDIHSRHFLRASNSVAINQLIDKLEAIATNDTLSASQRVATLKESLHRKLKVGHDRYDMRDEINKVRAHTEPYTWQWLQQCIEDLLDYLQIRTPKRHRYYHSLCQKLEKPDIPMQRLYEKNGFFKLETDMSEMSRLNRPQPA